MEKKYDLIDTILSIWNFKFLFLSSFIVIYFLILYFFLSNDNSYKSQIQFKQSNPVATKNFENNSANLFLLFIQNLNDLEKYLFTQESLSNQNSKEELYKSLYQMSELDTDKYIHSIKTYNLNIKPETLKEFHLKLFETINSVIIAQEINEVIIPKIDVIKNELKIINTLANKAISSNNTSQNYILVDNISIDQQIVSLNTQLYNLEYKLEKLKTSLNNENSAVEYYPEQITIQNLNNFDLVITFGFIVSFILAGIFTALYAIIYNRINLL